MVLKYFYHLNRLPGVTLSLAQYDKQKAYLRTDSSGRLGASFRFEGPIVVVMDAFDESREYESMKGDTSRKDLVIAGLSV